MAEHDHDHEHGRRGPDEGGGSDGGATDEALRELLHAEHHRTDVEARRRRGELQRQAAESLGLLDVARALAGSGQLAVVRTRSGVVPRSTVVEVGRDYVALRSEGPETRLVPVGAIASVRTSGAAPAPVAAPAQVDDRVGLHERVANLALRRPRVRATFGGGASTGELRRVGFDLLVVTEDDGTDVVIALDGLDELAL